MAAPASQAHAELGVSAGAGVQVGSGQATRPLLPIALEVHELSSSLVQFGLEEVKPVAEPPRSPCPLPKAASLTTRPSGGQDEAVLADPPRGPKLPACASS